MREYLRAAEEQDMELLFVWANEPEVRRNSFSTKEILYEEHQKWFTDLLNREDCRQYIYMQDNDAVGQIRITKQGEDAEIGYSIRADKRGMGHGKKILQLACEKVSQDFPEVKKLTAKVKPNNKVSQRAFIKTGFEKKYDVFELAVKNQNGRKQSAEIGK